MTVASPISWHVESWTLPSRRTCTSSFRCKGILPATSSQRCTRPAFPPVVQHLAPTPALPSLFSSIRGSFCLRDTPTLCKQPGIKVQNEHVHAVLLSSPPPGITTHCVLLPVLAMMTKCLHYPASLGTCTRWALTRVTVSWALLSMASTMTWTEKLKTRQQRKEWVSSCVVSFEWLSFQTRFVISSISGLLGNWVRPFVCSSLLTLPAAAVHPRGMRKKPMGRLAGGCGASRRGFLQERTAVLHLPTTTNRYLIILNSCYWFFLKKKLLGNTVCGFL